MDSITPCMNNCLTLIGFLSLRVCHNCLTLMGFITPRMNNCLTLMGFITPRMSQMSYFIIIYNCSDNENEVNFDKSCKLTTFWDEFKFLSLYDAFMEKKQNSDEDFKGGRNCVIDNYTVSFMIVRYV